MIRADKAFAERVEAAVRAIEARTDAEVVVVATGRSGGYRDAVFLGASLVSFAAFGLAIVAPVDLGAAWLWVDLAAVWSTSAWMLSAPAVLRRIVPRGRQLRQVAAEAAAEFHREAVHATPSRLGLLVLLSELEQRVELIADLGLEARIPRGEWEPAQRAFGQCDLDGFLAGLAAVGEILAARVPATAAGPGLELSDAPRIRP